MTGFGTLGSTTDPLALVPGSVDTLRADAQDLRARAAELESEAEGPVTRPVSAWTGEAADRAAQRRTQLAAALGGVADVYRTAATVLDAHAQVLAWAQAQAQVAIDLWAAGIDAAAAAGQSTFLLRPRNTGAFGLTPGASAVFEADPGAPLRRRAEAVLATAKREVTLSQSAAAQVLDQFSEGLPDGRFHFEEFLAGIGDWLTGLAGLVWKFNAIRAIVDGDAMIGDAQEMGQGVWDTGAYLISNPGETVPVLFDTQTMHDNPGRWWGRLAPDIALTAVGGVGLATRGGSTAVRGANIIDDLTDANRTRNLLGGPGGRFADGVDGVGPRPVPREYEHLPVRDEVSGQRGSWNRSLYDLEPETVYRVDDRHLYVTDEMRRVEHAESTLEYRSRDVADQHRNGYQQGIAGGADRLPGDQGGHTFAASLGGPGEPVNLFPMERALNQQGAGTFGSLEESWRSILRADPTARIDVEIDFEYPANSVRPNEIAVQYSVNGSPPIERSFYQ